MRSSCIVVAASLFCATAPAQYRELLTVLATSGTSFGWYVASIGDINNDQVADWGVSRLSPTEVNLVSGSDGSILAVLPSPLVAKAIVGGVDVSGDGIPDIALGYPDWAQTPGNGCASTSCNQWGKVVVISGAGFSQLWDFHGTGLWDGKGGSLAFVDDITGDGVPELAVGHTGVWGQSVDVHNGYTGAMLYGFGGSCCVAVPSYARHLRSITDIDGDGKREIVVSDRGFGLVEVRSGMTGALIYTISVPEPTSLDAGSDVTGDGIEDIVIGSMGINTTRVCSGLDGSLVHLVAYPVVRFGENVAFVGDINGDGVADFAGCGLTYLSFNGNGAIFSGATAAPLATFQGAPGSGHQLGFAMVPVPDRNGDGIGEILFAAPGEGTGVLHLRSYGGVAPYGPPSGIAPTLGLGWLPGAPPTVSFGNVIVVGAAPLASGLLAVSFAPAGILDGVYFVVVSVTPPDPTLLPTTYSGTGDVVIPIDLRLPALAGANLYLQAAEATVGGLNLSNGLEMFFRAP